MNLARLSLLLLAASALAFTPFRDPAFIANTQTNTVVGGGGSGGATNDGNSAEFISEFSTNSAGSSTTLTLLVSGLTPGKLVGLFAKSEGGQTPSSCAGNVSGAWSNATAFVQGSSVSGRWFYTTNASASDASVTVTYSGATMFRYINLVQLDPATTPVLDTQAGAGGTSSTAPSSGNMTLAGARIVLGGYAAFNNTTTSGFLVGTNSGVNSPEANASTYEQVWIVNTPTNSTAAATLTTASSVTYVVAAIAFRGTGVRTNFTSNYAHGYMDGTNQVTGTTLTTTILTNSSHGFPVDWSLSPTTPSGYTIADSFATKTKPVIVGGQTFSTGDAGKAFSLDAANSQTRFQIPIGKHRVVVVSGFFQSTIPSSGSGYFDMFRLDTVSPGSSHYNIFQFNKQNYNFRAESDPGGVTTQSPGYNGFASTIYSFSLMYDTQNGQGGLTIWDASGNVLASDTVAVNTTQEDIVFLKIGNSEAGLGTGALYFQHIMWNFNRSSYPLKP